MSARINLLNEPELPAPHEKLLRGPTFSEKYGWIKWLLIVTILVGMLDYGIIRVLSADSDSEVPPPVQQKMVALPTSAVSSADKEGDWSSYTNPNGKFKFEYPDGYTLKENASKSRVQLTSNEL